MPTNNTTRNDTTITLQAGDEFNALDLSHCIHCQLLRQIKKQILESVTPLRERDDMEKKAGLGLHHTGRETNYLFTGGRGSGKSTFLRNLIKLLLGEIEDKDAHEVQHKKLKLLCWHDPSESVGGEDYFFLAIAAALKSQLEKSITERRRTDTDNNFLIDCCKSSMKALDKGLVRLSNGRKALSELTPQRASELRITTPELDESIRKNFYDVVDDLCRICRVDSFIIAIDDADIRSEQCFRVLEDLRLYLRHPRLIILMTGDKQMYLERIREHFFKEFDNEYHKADAKGSQTRLDMVVSHASQYLIKLFPLVNQRELVDMYTLMHKNNPITFMLEVSGGIDENDHQEKQELHSLKNLVERIFELSISNKPAEVKPYVKLFFRLPLRSILQALNYWSSCNIWKQFSNSGKKTDNASEIGYLVKMAMKRILQDELRSSYYNFDSLDEENGRTFYTIMLRHCQNTGDLEHGYFLSGGVGGSNEEKYITMMLATAFKDRVRTVEGFLTYIIHGPATVSLFKKAVTKREQNIDNFPAIFNDYMQVGRDISASRWARRANMILVDPAGRHAGVLRFYEKTNTDAVRKVISDLENSNASSFDNLKQLLAMLVSLSMTDPFENAYIASIYNYLAFILKCCTACRACEGNGDKDKKINYEPLRDLISDYFTPKHSMYPEWRTIEKVDEKQMVCELFDASSYDGIMTNSILKLPTENDKNNIIKAIFDWYRDNAQSEYINEQLAGLTPHLVGDIWVKFFNSIESMYMKRNASERKAPFKLFSKAARSLSDEKIMGTHFKFITSFPLTTPLKNVYEKIAAQFDFSGKPKKR